MYLFYFISNAAVNPNSRCIDGEHLHKMYLDYQRDAIKYYHNNNQLFYAINIFSETHDVYSN